MLEKPRRNFLERSQISLLLLFLSSSLLISLIFFQVPAIIVSDTGDGQTGGGQWKSIKVQNADSSLSPLFPLPVLIDYEFAIGASRFSVAHKMNLLLHRGKPCYLGWQTRGQARKKWKINGPGLKQNSK